MQSGRAWDRGKDRDGISLGARAAPAFVPARDAASRHPDRDRGGSGRRDFRDRDAAARFLDREREWEREEADRDRARRRREEREREAERARARDLEDDLAEDDEWTRAKAEAGPGASFEDAYARVLAGGPPAWFTDERDAARRKRYRERELEADAKDKAREEAEKVAKRKAREAEEAEEDAAANRRRVGVGNGDGDARAGEVGGAAPETARGDAMEMDRPTAGALMPTAGALMPTPVPPPPIPTTPAPAPKGAPPASAPVPKAPVPKAPVVAAVLKPKSKKMGTRRTPTAASVFAAEDDEEEERPARRLVPIEYTPEELAAASRDAFDPPPNPARGGGRVGFGARQIRRRRHRGEHSESRRRVRSGRSGRADADQGGDFRAGGELVGVRGGERGREGGDGRRGPSVASPNFWGGGTRVGGIGAGEDGRAIVCRRDGRSARTHAGRRGGTVRVGPLARHTQRDGERGVGLERARARARRVTEKRRVKILRYSSSPIRRYTTQTAYSSPGDDGREIAS